MSSPAINHLAAIIVAGGKGTRLGAAQPKAFVELGGRPLLSYCINVFDSHPRIETLVVVVAPELTGVTRDLCAHCKHSIVVACGGEQRWNSVHNGVLASGAQCDWVLVHDAARPFVNAAVIDSLLEKGSDYRSAITATPIADTVREFSGDKAGATLDRNKLIRVGTPQLFHKQTLLEGFALAATLEREPTDEAMLMEALGVPVGIAPGDPFNFKITTPHDFAIAEAILAHQSTL